MKFLKLKLKSYFGQPEVNRIDVYYRGLWFAVGVDVKLEIPACTVGASRADDAARLPSLRSIRVNCSMYVRRSIFNAQGMCYRISRLFRR